MRRAALRLVLAALALAAAAWLLVPRPPLLDGVSFSRAVYDREGRLLRLTLSADDAYRLRVPPTRIPEAMVRATLLQEDRYFRWHPGVNPVSLLRAAWQTYVVRRRRVGGSTLTMQVARLRYGIDSSTLPGKLVQIARALQLERHYSKAELLEAYLNLAPYGGNIEGVGAASLIYLGQSVEHLTAGEAIALSVIPQDPVARAPARSGAPNAELSAAWEMLRGRWAAAYGEPAAPEPGARPTGLRRNRLPFLAPHFVDAVLADEAPPGAELVTTLDLEQQRLLERQVQRYVTARSRHGIHNAAALLIEHRTMAVRAVVGSAGFFDAGIAGQVNGTRAKRSPGSALKPFIYALALEQGLVHPRTMLKDAPASWGVYDPENYDGSFRGPLTATQALVQSRNVPAVALAARLDSPDLYAFLRQAGVSGLRSRAFYGLALVLGGAEVTMEELAGLYAMLANEGRHRPLRTHAGAAPAAGRRLLSPQAAFLTLKMLGENPRPDGPLLDRWDRHPHPVYWKTGTSYGFRDAWAVGVVGPYVLAVWVGDFDGGGNPAFVGRLAAAPLFFRIVDALRPGQALEAAFGPPAGVKRVEVCAVSGDLPGPSCPGTRKTWFIPGTSPIRTCTIHREVVVDTATGLRTCRGQGPGTRREVYEFWPSDLLAVFREAGIPRRVPPPFEPGCAAADRRGQPPQIDSPQRGLTYFLRTADPQRARIPLSAVTDADVRRVHWFVDGRYLGAADAGQPLYWRARPGRFVVRAVDDHGRGDATVLRVALRD